MRRAIVGGGRAMALVGAVVGWGMVAHAAEKAPAALARYIPGDDLVVYAEFAGLDADAAAWKASAVYQVLNRTRTGVMLEALATQLADRALADAPGPKLSGAEFVTLAKHALRSGLVFAINKDPGATKPACVALVARGVGRGPARPIVGRLIDAAVGTDAKAEPTAKPGARRVAIVRAGRGPGWAWWFEGDDLVVSLVDPKGADAIIAALEGKAPNAIDNPTRAALAKDDGGFRPVGLAFFDAAALPALPPKAAALGADGIRRLDFRWGFQGEALVTVTRLVAPAPRRGVLALFDQPTFGAGDLPPMPRGVEGFAVASVDPVKLLDGIEAVAEASDPNGKAMVQQVEQMIAGATGKDLRADLLKHLGPKAAFFAIPSKVSAPTNPLSGAALGLLAPAKVAMVVEVDDVEAFGGVLDDLVKQANAAIKAQAGPDAATAPEFRALKKGRGYTLLGGSGAFVMPLPAGLSPTIVLGRKALALGSTPEAARLALESEGKVPADSPIGKALGRLPKGLTFLSVSDTRASLLPEVVANLPALIQLLSMRGGPMMAMNPRMRMGMGNRGPGGGGLGLKIDPDDIPAPEEIRPFLFPATYCLAVDDEGIKLVSRESFPALNPAAIAPAGVALMLPAVISARSAARRAQSTNNLKQIGLAMHNTHSASNAFPPQATRDTDGKPLLSWRVAILPFLGQQALFNEFHQDEPWDSEHNKTLIEKMPMVYAVPGAKAEPGMTFYQAFAGKGTIYDPDVKGGVTIATVTDGTSNTIAVFEARTAVPWTKPEDLPFDADAKPEAAGADLLKKLGGHFPGGFNALFTDGSVRFIKMSIARQTLRALITRDGGEVISQDAF